GLYTILFSRLAGSGTVHAFEPDPLLFQTLRSNMARNGVRNVRFYPYALAGDNQNRYLHRGTFNSGDNRLSKSWPGSDEKILVEVRTLDKLLGNLKLDLLKIDTQGTELDVLKGAAKVLRSNTNLIVLCEFWPYGLKMNGTEPSAVLDLLRQHGFRIVHQVGNSWQEFRGSQIAMIKGRRYINLVAGRFLAESRLTLP
ncbi:MAG: FkbM family methyltransferase, partial [Verrucomicrobia bacterium]|nr:FkbM family methyltransferase [Verrucomicrobiota bacterium]